jgi:hypothetical protein
MCDEHNYRYIFRGVAVEMSETDCDALSSDILRKLLEASPEPDDMQTEQEARAQLIQDLTHLQRDVSERERDNVLHKQPTHAIEY